jgi:hypothetical protein
MSLTAILSTIFAAQIFSSIFMGHFIYIIPGILLNATFIFFVYCGDKFANIFRLKVISKPSDLKYSKKDTYFMFLLSALGFIFFIIALRNLPLIEAIKNNSLLQYRSDILSGSLNTLFARFLGFLSVVMTIYAIKINLDGYKGGKFFIIALITSFFNSILLAGRGYLFLNFFAITYVYLKEKISLRVLFCIATMVILFISLELVRTPDSKPFESFAKYLEIPLMGSSYIWKNGISALFYCENSLISKFFNSCEISMSLTPFAYVYDAVNVYGAVGQWLLVFSNLSIIPAFGFVIGIFSTFKMRNKSWINAMHTYLFGVFAFFSFFADPSMSNGFYFLILIGYFFLFLLSFLFLRSK